MATRVEHASRGTLVAMSSQRRRRSRRELAVPCQVDGREATGPGGTVGERASEAGRTIYMQFFNPIELRAQLAGRASAGRAEDPRGDALGAGHPRRLGEGRRFVWSMFEIIRIHDGRIVSVRPRPTTAPLLALRSSILRSRPGSEP